MVIRGQMTVKMQVRLLRNHSEKSGENRTFRKEILRLLWNIFGEGKSLEKNCRAPFRKNCRYPLSFFREMGYNTPGDSPYEN